MKLKKIVFMVLPFLAGITLVALFNSCSKDEDVPDAPSVSDKETEIKPVIKIIAKGTTTDDFIVSFRVKSVQKPNVTLSWGVYKKKTSSPKYTKSSSVSRTYDIVKSHTGNTSEYYYKVQHAGFMPGDYVYYQIEAYNSAGSDSDNGHMIIKR